MYYTFYVLYYILYVLYYIFYCLKLHYLLHYTLFYYTRFYSIVFSYIPLSYIILSCIILVLYYLLLLYYFIFPSIYIYCIYIYIVYIHNLGYYIWPICYLDPSQSHPFPIKSQYFILQSNCYITFHHSSTPFKHIYVYLSPIPTSFTPIHRELRSKRTHLIHLYSCNFDTVGPPVITSNYIFKYHTQ